MQNRFSVGRDCNCRNAHKEHILVYNGKRYKMLPMENGVKNREYLEVKKAYSFWSYKFNEHLDEIFRKYNTWRLY